MKLHLKSRFRNALAAFHPGEANYRLAIGEYSGFTVAYREGTVDERVIGHSFDNDIFFAGVPEYRPGLNDVIIDIGAHIGTFSLLAAVKAPRGLVHAVEASREAFNYLRVNVALNKTANIIPHRVALSDREGEVTLHHDRGNWGHSIMKQHLSTLGEQVPAMSLPTFMTVNGISDISFIKFNCEGAEFPILMATPVDLLERVRMMLVLYHLDMVENHTLDSLLAHLKKADFTTALRQQRGPRGWIIASRLR